MEIALFDIWIANEDRNWNNANLLYDIVNEKLIVIDHGCIFNTATFDYSLCQLTTTDSILRSDLARNLLVSLSDKTINELTNDLRVEFYSHIKECHKTIKRIVNSIPKEWHVPLQLIENKLSELMNPA